MSRTFGALLIIAILGYVPGAKAAGWFGAPTRAFPPSLPGAASSGKTDRL